jgi:hypothetical protein
MLCYSHSTSTIYDDFAGDLEVAVAFDDDAIMGLRRPRTGDGEEDAADVATAADFMALPNRGRCGCAVAAADALMSAADRPDAEVEDGTEAEGKNAAMDDEEVPLDLRRSNKEDEEEEEEEEVGRLGFEMSSRSSLSSPAGARVAGANGATLRRAMVTEGDDEDDDDDAIAEGAESEDEAEEAVDGDCLTAAREFVGMGKSSSSPKGLNESAVVSAEAAVNSGLARFALAPFALGSSSTSSAMLST